MQRRIICAEIKQLRRATRGSTRFGPTGVRWCGSPKALAIPSRFLDSAGQMKACVGS